MTAAKDGDAYAASNGTDSFVDWMKERAADYAAALQRVQGIVNNAGEDAAVIVVAAYYDGVTMDFDVFSPEADPRVE